MYYTVQNGEEDEIIDRIQASGGFLNPESVVSLEAFFNDPYFVRSIF